jgi:histidine triad (HIT) family protein
MDKCIFCMIANKEIPAHIIYENEHVISFLDINPLAKGHCLVIPKKHYKDVFDMPANELNKVIEAAKQVSVLIKNKLEITGVNLLNASGKDAQQSVFHFHMHIIPRNKDDGLDTWPKSNYKESNIDSLRKKLKE